MLVKQASIIRHSKCKTKTKRKQSTALPRNAVCHKMFLTEQSNMSLALPLLHIINANFIAHTIDNIRLNTLFFKQLDIVQHSPLLKGYALTFPTCTPLRYLIIFYCTRVLEILNFVGSLANKMAFVNMIRWVGRRLGRKLGGEV